MKMGYLLEKTCSSYYPAYCSMVQSIEDALEEARDIRLDADWLGLEGSRDGGSVGRREV